MHRRDAIKVALSAGVGGAVVSGLSAAVAHEEPSTTARFESKTRAPFRLVYEAEWNDIPCADYPLTPEKWAEESIAPLAGTDVDCLLYNLCSSDAYVCQLNNGEIIADAFDKLQDAWVWRYRENTKYLIAADANPPKLACEYGHRLGMLVMPVVRMNDMHDMFFKFELSRFKASHPELLLGRGKQETGGDFGGFTWGMFDFAHQEVRDHKLAIIDEFITRWDNDGICLDFDRDPRFFQEEGEAANARIMTEMIRTIRAKLDRVARQRNRPQYLYVRVVPNIDVCCSRGLDVRTWVRDGLVDVVAPGCGYMTFSLDLSEWRELLKGTSCRLVPCINKWKPTEQTRGWAKLMLQRGADGVQLFNYGHLLFGFGADVNPRDVAGDGSKDARLGTVWWHELHPDYYTVLDELGDIHKFAFKNSRYVWESVPRTSMTGEGGLSHRRFRAIDAVALPVSLTPGEHKVSFGFADDLNAARQLGFAPRVTLRSTIANCEKPGSYPLSINRRSLSAHAADVKGPTVSYDVPTDCLTVGENELTINVVTADADPVAELSQVEIEVVYLDPPPTRTIALDRELVPVDAIQLPSGPLTVGEHIATIDLTGSAIDAIASASLKQPALRLKVDNYTYPDEFDVRLNGRALSREARSTRAVFIMNNQSWVTYLLERDMIHVGKNEIVIDIKGLNPSMSIPPVLLEVRVELQA